MLGVKTGKTLIAVRMELEKHRSIVASSNSLGIALPKMCMIVILNPDIVTGIKLTDDEDPIGDLIKHARCCMEKYVPPHVASDSLGITHADWYKLVSAHPEIRDGIGYVKFRGKINEGVLKKMLDDGLSNKEIASHMGVDIRSVNNKRRYIGMPFRKKKNTK